MKMTVRIATRKSPLALWQANFVKQQLHRHHPTLEVKLLGMLTTADKLLVTPLAEIGGKSLFVKELEKAMLEQVADIAVHSIKDMPAVLPDGLTLAVVMQREDPRDVFVSDHYHCLLELAPGAVVGTSSLRRKAQVLALRPDLNVQALRGNVGTRLQRLEEGKYDAIILAAAGLKRLKLETRIKSYFSLDEMLPAIGQGAIGIECRHQDTDILELLSVLEDESTRYCVMAERVFNAQLGGSCQSPLAAHAQVTGVTLSLRGLISNEGGSTMLRAVQEGPIQQAREIGLAAAAQLIAQGATSLLRPPPVN